MTEEYVGGSLPNTPLAEQEASSALAIAKIIRSEFRHNPPASLDVEAMAADLAVGMPHTAPVAVWAREAGKRVDMALRPFIPADGAASE